MGIQMGDQIHLESFFLDKMKFAAMSCITVLYITAWRKVSP